jgi:hypothetical protein
MKKARETKLLISKRKLRVILFLATAFAGIVIGASMTGIALYQLINLNQLINENQQYGMPLDNSMLSHMETNYVIIIIAVIPLIILSLILMHRSLQKIRRNSQR